MVTQKLLKKLFDYNSDSGKVTVNGIEIGSIDNRGYLTTSIKGKSIQMHRLAYMHHHGYMPDYIDHIDGNKLNNKISNLRSCRQQQNCYNRGMSKNNRCGVKGVYWDKLSKAWRAQLSINGKNTNLGCFWDIETAIQVLKVNRLKYHGEFANNG